MKKDFWFEGWGARSDKTKTAYLKIEGSNNFRATTYIQGQGTEECDFRVVWSTRALTREEHEQLKQVTVEQFFVQ